MSARLSKQRRGTPPQFRFLNPPPSRFRASRFRASALPRFRASALRASALPRFRASRFRASRFRASRFRASALPRFALPRFAEGAAAKAIPYPPGIRRSPAARSTEGGFAGLVFVPQRTFLSLRLHPLQSTIPFLIPPPFHSVSRLPA